VEWPEGLLRTELVAGIVAAIVLVISFGSGLDPLGRSHDSARAAMVRQTVAPPIRLVD